MSDVWTIKGQAGKSVDETERSLAALGMEGTEVFFDSLADDTLTWDVWLRSNTQIATRVPDYAQRISLYLNGDRYFTGYVTGRDPAYEAGRWGYRITVSGPWFFLSREPLSSEIPDETTVVQERAVYLFPAGSPTDRLISLVSRAIERGLPLSLGSIATCSACPRIALREMSIGEGVSEVMRMVVDGLVYFDHSGADGTHPALCMQRRSVATVIEITPAVVAVPKLVIKPRFDLKVSELKVNSARRQTYNDFRANAFRVVTEGASTGEMPDRQIITVSGPEPGLGLPQDMTDSVVVQSAAISGHIAAALMIWHDLLKAGEADLAGVEVYATAVEDSAAGTTTYWPQEPMVIATDADGNDLTFGDWPYYLTKGEIKDWWEKDGIESMQARVTAAVASHVDTGLTDDAPETPKWAKVLGATLTIHNVLIGGTLHFRYVWQAHVSTTIPLVKTLWEDETTLIRQEDWGWFNPPSGFAAYLLETQAFVPWEGPVPVATDDTPANNAVGSVLNIAGWVPECADMKGLISSYSVRPATGQITYTLGPPARHSYRDLVNRFRQSGADNIYWLNNAGGGIGPGPDPDGPPDYSILDEDGTNYEINEDGTNYTTTEDS